MLPSTRSCCRPSVFSPTASRARHVELAVVRAKPEGLLFLLLMLFLLGILAILVIRPEPQGASVDRVGAFVGRYACSNV